MAHTDEYSYGGVEVRNVVETSNSRYMFIVVIWHDVTDYINYRKYKVILCH